MLRTTLIQADLVWEDQSVNLQQFDQRLAQLSLPTDLVILPEMFSTGFSMNSDILAEQPQGATHQWMLNWADRLNAAVTGSYMVQENNQYFNRLLWIEPGGAFYTYDKHHLFGLAGETQAFAAGQKQLKVNWRGWCICPLICYDLRFPLWSRNQVPYYDLLIYVASWPATRADHWRSLLQARAIENQAYVIGVNRVGTDHNQLPYQGDSSVYDYAGNLLSRVIREEQNVQCVLSKAPLDTYRRKLPFLDDMDSYEFI